MYNRDARILELAKYSPVKNVRYISWEDAFDLVGEGKGGQSLLLTICDESKL